MRGHGLIVTGETVPWATYAALTLERVLQIQSIALSLGNLRPMSAEMADRVYPEKYRDDHLAKYWDYLVRQVLRAGLAAGMPGSGGDRA
jgi:ribulose-5-phosphate 4-epimerase/fuculose-1-phosphate aldolase